MQTINYATPQSATPQPFSYSLRGRVMLWTRSACLPPLSDLIAERMTQVRDSRLASAEAIFAQLERELAECGARKAGVRQ